MSSNKGIKTSTFGFIGSSQLRLEWTFPRTCITELRGVQKRIKVIEKGNLSSVNECLTSRALEGEDNYQLTLVLTLNYPNDRVERKSFRLKDEFWSVFNEKVFYQDNFTLFFLRIKPFSEGRETKACQVKKTIYKPLVTLPAPNTDRGANDHRYFRVNR